MKKQNGFTLIELLVVIVIIGLLAALLVPAVKNGLDAAKKAQCQGNLKEIGKTLLVYIGNHDGVLPEANNGTDTWHEILNDEIIMPGDNISGEGIFKCPADPAKDATGYGWNDSVTASGSNFNNFKVEDFEEPDVIGIVADSVSANTITSISGSGGGSVAYRHKEQANLLFLDWHVSGHLKSHLLYTGGASNYGLTIDPSKL